MASPGGPAVVAHALGTLLSALAFRAGQVDVRSVVHVGDAVALLVDLAGVLEALDPRVRVVVGGGAVVLGSLFLSVGPLLPVLSGTSHDRGRGLRPRDPSLAVGDREPASGSPTARRRQALGMATLGVVCLVLGTVLFLSVRPGF